MDSDVASDDFWFFFVALFLGVDSASLVIVLNALMCDLIDEILGFYHLVSSFAVDVVEVVVQFLGSLLLLCQECRSGLLSQAVVCCLLRLLHCGGSQRNETFGMKATHPGKFGTGLATDPDLTHQSARLGCP